MNEHCSRRRGGFSLVDLLVLTAAGALLLPLSLVVLRDANEQASRTECLSNLQGLMRATSAYLNDYSGDFPIFTRTAGGLMGICPWNYGGKTSSDY